MRLRDRRTPTAPPPATGGYREHAPAPALRPFVACYWTRTAALGATGTSRVLPDGCVDLIVIRGGGDPQPRVVGAMTQAIVLPQRGGVSYVAVRFRPGGAAAFFAPPQRELVDGALEVGELWRPESDWLSELDGHGTPEASVQALERELLRRLPRARPLDVAVQGAVRLLEQSRGRLPVGALAERLGVSRQHLARRFALEVGLSPKALGRVLRLQGLVGRLNGVAQVDWAGAAIDAGYGDQAHLIDEFKALVGLTPSRWLRER